MVGIIYKTVWLLNLLFIAGILFDWVKHPSKYRHPQLIQQVSIQSTVNNNTMQDIESSLVKLANVFWPLKTINNKLLITCNCIWKLSNTICKLLFCSFGIGLLFFFEILFPTWTKLHSADFQGVRYLDLFHLAVE